MSLNKDVFTIGSNKRFIRESITPHKICVAVLIRQFCLFRESARFRIMPPAMKPIQRKDFCILILQLIQNPDLTLSELRNVLISGKYNIEPRFVIKFDHAIYNLNKVGVGNLLDLAEYISRLTIDLQLNGIWCQINKNSILGCYLRRLMVFFDKLTFTQVISVYESFKRYYKPCEVEIYEKRHFFELNDTQNDNIEEKIYEPQDYCPPSYIDKTKVWSQRQSELFIATQSTLLINNEAAAQNPTELSEHIKCVLKTNPDLPEAFFLQYVNFLRVKEFCGAVDSLHGCFDRCTPVGRNSTIEEKSKAFRYATLNLAALHIKFGHKEEAFASLKESISLAQEANDNICLQHALCWLYKLTSTNKELLMQHSIIKSMDLNLLYIASLGVQSYMQHAGLSGGTPKSIYETMIKSDIMNCQNTYRDLMSNSYSQRASLWSLYGKTQMSSLWSQLLLHTNSDNLNSGKVYHGEGTCQALCHIANSLLLEGEYEKTYLVLQLAKKYFPNEPLSHNWNLCECLLSFVKTLHNGEWSKAETAAIQMSAFDKWESCFRLAELYIAKSDFLSAYAYVNNVIDNCQDDPDCKLTISFKIRAMILLAELQCTSATTQNIPTSIITVLNSALSFSHLYHLDYLSSLIHMHLANIQLLLGMPCQALKILDQHLVQILTHGGRYDIARASLLQVKCIIADSGKNPNVDRNAVILDAVKLLDQVREDFHKVEARSKVKDVLFFQAQLYNELDLIEERNSCALEYKKYNLDYPSKPSKTFLTSF